MSVADKRKARLVELNTLPRPLTDKEEEELRFLEKQLETAERVAHVVEFKGQDIGQDMHRPPSDYYGEQW